MKLTEKLKFIQDNHFNRWLSERGTVRNEFSDKQSIFCLCGKLATGLHEGYCKKLSDAITKETLKRLNCLLPK